ncbi:MAG: glycosyltransferase family 2 protein, partial [Actinobacteria bacterium]|nr:glycosyltransferase family 2 protein [Actinomycetota bacterium]
VRRWGLRFDEDFGLAGGSDTLFTRQLVRAGGRIVYCSDAVVTDPVPVDRATRAWVLRRRFRFGNAWSRVELRLRPTAAERGVARARLVAGGGARVGAGLARHLVGWLTASRARRAAGLGQAARGLGMVLGAFGYVYREYRRPAG